MTPVVTRKSDSQRTALAAFEVVLSISVVLCSLALLLPALAQARAAASQNQSQNNLKLLALSAISFGDTYRVLPPAVGDFNQRTGSAHYFLLPFLEQGEVWNKGNAVWDNDTWSTPIKTFTDPQDASAAPQRLPRLARHHQLSRQLAGVPRWQEPLSQ